VLDLGHLPVFAQLYERLRWVKEKAGLAGIDRRAARMELAPQAAERCPVETIPHVVDRRQVG